MSGRGRMGSRRGRAGGAPVRARVPAALVRGVAALLLAAAVLAVGGALRAAPASAHANVESADPPPDAVLPAPPARVTIRFSEPLAPTLSAIQVLDATGARVDARDSTVDPGDAQRMTVSLRAIPDGTYTVFWRNVSTVDGHALRGTYVFYVGAKPANAPASSVQATPLFTSRGDPVVRGLVLAGLLTAFGAAAFALTVGGPATAGSAAAAAVERRTRRVAIAGWALLAAGTLAHPLVQAAAAADVSVLHALGAPLRDVVTGSRWGHLWVVRAALAGAAGVALLAWGRAPAGRWARRAAAAALGLLGAAMVTLSLASHAAVTPNVAPAAVMSDLVHLLGAGAWAGGLVAMALAIPAARRIDDAAARRATVAALAERFTAMAILGTGAIAVTGAFSAWAQVSTWSALGTAYGRTVTFKAIVFALLVGLGALNLFVLRRRVASGAPAGRWLGRVVVVEVVLAAAVVLAAGVLTSLEPARQTASREAAAAGIRFAQQDGTTRVAVAVQPGTTGTNRVVIDLTDQRGRAVSDATRVAVRVQFAGADLGATDLTAAHTSGGRYVAEGAQLSLAGRWQVEVTASRPDAVDARVAWRFDVARAGTAAAERFAPTTAGGNFGWAWEVILLGGLLLGVTNTWWTRERSARALNVLGSLAVLAGVVMWFGLGHAHTGPASTTGAVNPFAPSEASIAQGRATYQANCVACHGVGGAGDGPDAAGLDPPPADLVTHVPLHSDGDLFTFIANGFPRTAMPAWKGQLTNEQIWNLVNFLRTIAAGAPATVPPGGTPSATPTTPPGAAP